MVIDTGVDAKVPISDRNLSNVFFIEMQMMTVKITMIDLSRFLSNYLFLDFGMSLNK